MIRSSSRALRLLAAAVFVGIVLAMSPGLAQAERPNIVIIQTDDQNARTAEATFRKYLGGQALIMPNTVREIFRGGTEFDNYYATSPTCAPSRASLLTGQYPQNSGLDENSGPQGGWDGWQNLPAYEDNMAVSLQQAGYRTSHFGKFLNGYYRTDLDQVETTVPPGWDNWFTTSYISQMLHYGYKINDNGVARAGYGSPLYTFNTGVDPKRCTAETLIRQSLAKGCRYQADVLTRAAVREIRRNAAEPLFLQIDYEGPHGDVRPPVGPQPASRHTGSTSWTGVPRPPNFNEADMSDKSPEIQTSAPVRMGFARYQWLKYYYLRYLASLRAIDDGVGAIVETLRQTGKLKDTYIFFLSDHGSFLGEHRFDHAKFMPYDGASKVAMAVRGPGVPAGKRSGELVANIDIAPTVLDLVGAGAAWQIDGRSMRPFWRNPKLRTRRPVGISFVNTAPEPNSGGASISAAAPKFGYRGFRVGPYKYFRFNDSGNAELYDMQRDPWELDNRVNTPEYLQTRQYMQDWLPIVDGCVGVECRAQLPPWPVP